MKKMVNISKEVKDFIYILIVVIFIGTLSLLFDFYGKLRQFIRIFENLRAGEVVLAFYFLTTGLVWYIWQRLKESRIEIKKRKKIEDDLRRAQVKLRETQNQLVQAEKLNAVGQLASGVAHEVRNPLGIILQASSLLRLQVPLEKKGNLEALNMIDENVERANKIIDSLLNFSRATTLELKLEDINTVLKNSLALVKTKLKLENVDVTRELKNDLPMVLIDKNKMEQVLVNLILNAIQAMPKGGKISVRTYDKQLVRIKERVGKRTADYFRVGERAVIVEVEDSGTGISEEHLKRIFDPFFTTKGKKGGTGLGLSVCYKIIHLHSGLIEIESKKGRGTKVIITLKIVNEKNG